MAKGRHSGTPQRGRSSYSRSGYRARSRKGRGAGALAALLIAVILVLGGSYLFLSDHGGIAEGEEVTVEIAEGSSVSDIAHELRDAHLISSVREFRAAVEESGLDTQLKPGTYTIVGGTSLDDIIAVLVAGRSGTTLTVYGGDTARSIAERVEVNCGIPADAFYAVTQQAPAYEDDYPFLKDAYNGSMEGYLYPGTYSVKHDATADDVARQMLDAFSAQLASVDMGYAQAKNLTVSDVVVLASIVQKEAATEDDMPDIAAVFYNRLHEGMNLGSDVTTYYAVGKELGEELTKADLASESPYNTRNANNKGLPPGPIGSFSLAALQAAAQPSSADYLYFFYSEKEGKTMFFKEAKEFDEAWERYGG